MKFIGRHTGNTVFPSPEPGEAVGLNPPPLQWVPEPGSGPYRVTVTGADGETLFDVETERNVFRFPAKLPAGRYRWNVRRGADERGEWAFTVPPDAVEFLPPSAEELLAALPAERPRHIYFPEELASLAAAHPVQLAILERNVKLALEEGFMRYPDFWRAGGRTDYRSALDEVRRFLDRNTAACALLWLFRRERRAGEYARRALLTVCEWNPAGACSVAGPWGDEVGLSIVRILPAVFDWVYELLSPQERRWAAETLRQHARQVYGLLTEGDYFGEPGNSHSGRLPGYLGELALVLHGEIPEEECRRWLACALDLYGSIFPHYGGRDGGWAEGPFYASSYTKWYLPFFLAVERISGFSFLVKPFFRHVAEFFQHFAVPGMECHPFGDGHWPTESEWPGFQAQNPFGIYAERFGPELARRFSARCDAAIERYELHLLDVIRPEPRAPLPPESRVGTDRSYVSHDAGLASLHTCLACPERDIAVFARASRYGTPSHQHADQGDFALLIGGQAFLAPSGSFGYQFGEPHHRIWTQQTVAANCFLIDGEGQKKNSPEATGWMETELEREDVSRIVMHLEEAYPMLERCTRTLIFNHRTGALTVTDEIRAAKPVAPDWRLHSYVAPEPDGAGFRIVRPAGILRFEVRGPGEAVYSAGNRYCYPNGAAEETVPCREREPQWHMNWRFAPAKEFVIEAVFHPDCNQRRKEEC